MDYCDSPVADYSTLLDDNQKFPTIWEYKLKESGVVRQSSVFPTVRSHSQRPRSTKQILILGSNYTHDDSRTFTVCSKMTLEGAENDAEALKTTLRRQGYLTHDIINNELDRSTVLRKISNFLAFSYPGDIRIIVFTGHAYTQSTQPMIVPPCCPTKESAISPELWEQTVRDNARAGVIVLSIFANCYAGGFMQQDHLLSQLDNQLPFTQPPNLDTREPIFLTFASSLLEECSFESPVAGWHTHDAIRVADHFLHALNLTASSPLVNNWGAFIAALENNFRRTRERCFTDPDDIIKNPQTPKLTYSCLPPFSTLFPAYTRNTLHI
ncbi:hypothetical protein FRC12_017128 [Ceratobasidium sp. 428]|nr:hypothetical protein FRC12_017128 [Ceratobasidium sp. 428]